MREYLERGRRGLFAAGVLAALGFGATEAFAGPGKSCDGENEFPLGTYCWADCPSVCAAAGYPLSSPCEDGCCTCQRF